MPCNIQITHSSQRGTHELPVCRSKQECAHGGVATGDWCVPRCRVSPRDRILRTLIICVRGWSGAGLLPLTGISSLGLAPSASLSRAGGAVSALSPRVARLSLLHSRAAVNHERRYRARALRHSCHITHRFYVTGHNLCVPAPLTLLTY